MNGRWRQWLLVLAGVLLSGQVSAQLQLEALQVVDVTPTGFTLIGRASEAAQPTLVLYADAAGTQDISDQLEVIPYALQSGYPMLLDEYDQTNRKLALEGRLNERGLLQVRVQGAMPATTYYYHLLVDNGSEQVQWPAGLPAAVTTAQENAFLSGSHQVLLTINGTDPEGWLVTASSTETSHPVSAVVGDGAGDNQAYLNLANLFGGDGRNWQPDGDREITIEVHRGWQSATSEAYTLSLPNTFSVSNLYPLLIDLLGGPQFDMLLPAYRLYTTGGNIPLGWSDEAPGSATIALYYDDDASGEDGTEIVSGLAEDPDGVDDNYSWDTVAVADGIYHVYGILDDAGQTASSYAANAVAIDRSGTDSDTDLIADLWELLFFGDLTPDPTSPSDSDGDGLPDGGEFGEQTDPTVPDVRLALREGLNVLSWPIALAPGQTSHQLAQALGAAVLRISRLNPTTQQMEITEVVGGVPQGANFPITAHEGYFIEMASPVDYLGRGTAVAEAIDLTSGQNLVGFQRVPDGFDAYQLLAAVGNDSEVASIRRYDPLTGRYQTVAYHNGQPSGPNFPIRRNEGYIIGAVQPISGVVLP